MKISRVNDIANSYQVSHTAGNVDSKIFTDIDRIVSSAQRNYVIEANRNGVRVTKNKLLQIQNQGKRIKYKLTKFMEPFSDNITLKSRCKGDERYEYDDTVWYAVYNGYDKEIPITYGKYSLLHSGLDDLEDTAEELNIRNTPIHELIYRRIKQDVMRLFSYKNIDSKNADKLQNLVDIMKDLTNGKNNKNKIETEKIEQKAQMLINKSREIEIKKQIAAHIKETRQAQKEAAKQKREQTKALKIEQIVKENNALYDDYKNQRA